ncbi:MAG: hypothetical protein ACFFAS_13960 [Promethearchaeota archaeon]
MANTHLKFFYGSDAGLNISSPGKKIPYITLTCFKRKQDGNWENPIKGEGKTIRLTIEEIICFLEVLKGNHAKWRGYHIHGNRKTEIIVSSENELKQEVSIKIGAYEKKIKFPNLKYIILLLEHILLEKIEFASDENSQINNSESVFSEQITTKDGYDIVETTKYSSSIDKIEITAKIIAESPKALLISIDIGHEFWIPKNSVHSSYDSKKKSFQQFFIDKWIIEKNLLSMYHTGE